MIRSILHTSFTAAIALVAAPAQTSIVQEPLSASGGWDAALIHRATGGVWYAFVDQAIDAYGAPEAIFADDDGRVTVLSVYSGKWTERSVNPDGRWLAPSRPADVDPRVPGKEIYAAGAAGNVHRIVISEPHPNRYQLDSVEIAHVADEEFHCIVAADLNPDQPGDELLVFGLSGNVYRLAPDLRDGDPGSSIFTLTRVATLPGRVRDAVSIPAEADAPRLVGVSRSGHLLAMRLTQAGLDHESLTREPMGLGRIAWQAPIEGRGEAFFVTRDDGVVLRFEARPDGLQREVIFAGPQGPRGIAVGRFDADPSCESVAVFGYSRAVQMLTRRGDEPWRAQTIYTDADQGHWLTVGEVDGRNGTDELIATGFGGQVILLARPPGYALPGAAVQGPIEPHGTSRPERGCCTPSCERR